MGPRRVFILYRSGLFARGLGALLSEIPGLALVGMAPSASGDDGVRDSVQSSAPDVVVLEQEEAALLARVPDIVPDARMVALSLNNNRIRVYQCRELDGGDLEGVVDAIMLAAEGVLGAP